MGDIECKKCGEPWDAFSLDNNMTKKEKRNLLAGKGCPTCDNTKNIFQ